MRNVTFNMVSGYGNEDRTIYRINDTCKIGITYSTKEEAIASIVKKYESNDRDNYIAKIEELFDNSCSLERVAGVEDEILPLACVVGHLELVKQLIETPTGTSLINDNIVMIASTHGHLDIVKYLVSVGADVTANDNWALQLASEYGHLEVVEYLESITK